MHRKGGDLTIIQLKLHTMIVDRNELKTSLRTRFGEYLSTRGLRHTSSRYVILDKVVDQNVHFDIQALYRDIRKSHSVSLASVYQTVELLCECGILRKQYLSENQASYELSDQKHLHLICIDCGAVAVQDVRELKDIEAVKVAKEIAGVKYRSFYPTFLTANVYGRCEACQKKYDSKIKNKST